jgi:hypothetical protein
MIPGHSGCKIYINNKVVTKASINYSNNRLLAQAKKQKEYYSLTSPFKIPKIFRVTNDHDTVLVEMEHVNAIDMIQFLATKPITKINLLIDRIIAFIEADINRSVFTYITKKLIFNKLDTLEYPKSFNSFFDKLPDTFPIPVGYCHGDLTLSNILYSNNQFILIDFLDSFIESPIIDLAKIRQDTKHMWTVNLANHNYNMNRLNSVFKHIDDRIFKHFDKYHFMEYFPQFELLNLLRVIPYSNKETQLLLLEQAKTCLH